MTKWYCISELRGEIRFSEVEVLGIGEKVLSVRDAVGGVRQILKSTSKWFATKEEALNDSIATLDEEMVKLKRKADKLAIVRRELLSGKANGHK